MSRLATLAFVLSLASPLAQANPLADVVDGTTTSYGQVTSTYLIAGVERELSHQRLSLDFSELGNSWFYGGITVGISFLDGENEPLIDDNSVPGYNFGVFGGVRLRYFDDRLGIHFEGRYLREWFSGMTSTGDDTAMKFGEGNLRAGLSWRFDAVQLSAGGYSRNSVGDIERAGVVSGTADLQEVDAAGAYAGVDIKLDDGYAFGFRAESGARETYALTFSTGF